jgi:threonylcarbamoyladenosine tRNA methylthiotransferase MtaB
VKKISFYTLGCKANQYQTEVLKSQFSTLESRISDFGDPADLYVINTCTVTEDADRKSRQAIRRALRLGKKVIVTGCYARLEGEKLKEAFPEIILTPLIPLSISDGEGETPTIVGEGVRIRANLMIQDGCEHFCSYCIVPHARGKVKSKPAEEVVTEAERLIAAGAREIILTGINLGTYQHDLSEVLRRLSSAEGLLRLRLSSLEPMYLTKGLIDAIAETPKVCHHLHIPLQSGDNAILKAMNRNYTRDDYLELISYVRKKMPDCGVTTDIIVGFPGEGEREFQNTIDLISKVEFSRVHVFTYSKRERTPAAGFTDQIDAMIKKQRNKVLHKLRNKYMKKFAQQYLGKQVEVLVEQKGEGLTSNYIRCFFNGPIDSSGSLKKIFVRSVNNAGEIGG